MLLIYTYTGDAKAFDGSGLSEVALVSALKGLEGPVDEPYTEGQTFFRVIHVRPEQKHLVVPAHITRSRSTISVVRCSAAPENSLHIFTNLAEITHLDALCLASLPHLRSLFGWEEADVRPSVIPRASLSLLAQDMTAEAAAVVARRLVSCLDGRNAYCDTDVWVDAVQALELVPGLTQELLQSCTRSGLLVSREGDFDVEVALSRSNVDVDITAVVCKSTGFHRDLLNYCYYYYYCTEYNKDYDCLHRCVYRHHRHLGHRPGRHHRHRGPSST